MYDIVVGSYYNLPRQPKVRWVPPMYGWVQPS